MLNSWRAVCRFRPGKIRFNILCVSPKNDAVVPQLPRRTWVSRMMREPPRYVEAKICMMPLRPSSAPMTANTLLGTLVCSGVMALPYRIIGRMYAKLKGMSANRQTHEGQGFKRRDVCTCT